MVFRLLEGGGRRLSRDARDCDTSGGVWISGHELREFGPELGGSLLLFYKASPNLKRRLQKLQQVLIRFR